MEYGFPTKKEVCDPFLGKISWQKCTKKSKHLMLE